jgi:adenosylhomocysteine nucleosidase
MQTGMGIADAAQLTDRIMNTGASGLISIGTAGGLTPDLQPGALLLPSCIRHINGKKFTADPEWHAHVHAALKCTDRVHTGDLLSVTDVVRHPDRKDSLHRETEAIGVDMESAGLAEIAARAGLPFLVLRVVMDTVRDEIPEAATVSIGETGDTQSMALLSHLARNISELPGMLRTLRRFRNAAASLREACWLARNELLCPG